MSYAKAQDILKQVFNQENFHQQSFEEFIYHLFAKNINIFSQAQFIDSKYQNHIANCTKISDFAVDKHNKLAVFVIKLNKDLDRSRTIQRNFVADILKSSNTSYALVAFVSYDNSNWRFSLVKLDYVLDEKNNVIEKSSPARRFSFLVGKNEGSHTVKKQFLKILANERNSAPTIAEIEQAFNIETVTAEFFKEYKELYLTTKEQLEDFLAKNLAEQQYFADKKISTADFAKKTLGQIVFLYFLQKKGWFGVKPSEPWGSGNKNFLKNYFDENHQHKNFFKQCLEPLFYEALAVNRGAESLYEKIDNLRFPFLNGGLFEPMPNYLWQNSSFTLPNELFSNQNKTKEDITGDGILDVFNRYNFTVNENEPLEQEVAVDPEMLGKVFENLLDVVDRKSQGAFYTPRSIVHYMCQEVLIQYLANNSGLEIANLSNFIKNDNSENLKKHQQEIDKLLQDVKICDPAIGSGAFALGMLQEIVSARLKLAEIHKQNSYDLKLHTIENCIYGVDLNSSAVDIAKLRLWLALVVEETEPKPLPNLDYKIMQGNSLLESYEEIKLFDGNLFINQEKVKDLNSKIEVLRKDLLNFVNVGIQKSKNPDYSKKEKELERLLKEFQELSKQSFDKNSTSMFDLQDNQLQQKNKLNDLFTELQQLIKKYFSENNKNNKTQLKKQITQLKYSLIETTLISQNKQDKLIEIQQLQQINRQPFFIWELEFSDVFSGENVGFDIVIGNPPYIQLQKDGGKLGNMFATAKFSTFAKSGDIYCLFYELGNNILNEGGHLAFITSNKWMRAGYGEKLRSFLSQKTSPKILIDLGPSVFETATVDTNILLYQKKSAQQIAESSNCLACTIQEKLTPTQNSLTNYVVKNAVVLNKFSSQAWVIANPLEQQIKTKIETLGVPLKNWDVKINYGIKTGFNEAFIIDTKTKEELCLADPKSAEIIKPILRGRDIGRYSTNWAGLWVIVAKYQSHKYLENSYPTVFAHLKKFEKELKQRGQCTNRDGKGQHHWLELDNNPTDDYLMQFEKEKIVWGNISYKSQFCYDDFSFVNAPANLITSNTISVKYLIAIMNSAIFSWEFENLGITLGKAFEWKKQYVENIHIPQIPAASQAPFIAIVNEILSITSQPDYNPSYPKARQKELERQIDEMVCDLYQLTEQEKNFILQGN